jgi:excisionase family DNA binding protein
VTDPPPDVVAVVRAPALLSVRTVAGLLDVSTRTVRRRIDEGALPAVVDHDRLMVRGDDYRAYVDRLPRVGGRPQPRARRAAPRRLDFLRE